MNSYRLESLLQSKANDKNRTRLTDHLQNLEGEKDAETTDVEKKCKN